MSCAFGMCCDRTKAFMSGSMMSRGRARRASAARFASVHRIDRARRRTTREARQIELAPLAASSADRRRSFVRGDVPKIASRLPGSGAGSKNKNRKSSSVGIGFPATRAASGSRPRPECTSRIERNSLGIDLQGAASCALGCRCLSLVSACRVQSCREKLRSKSPWIAR